MSLDVRSSLPARHPASGDAVKTAMDAIYNWSYESEIEQIRTLYANALERQWIAMRDLDWDADVDKEAFSDTFSMGGIPISETEFWRGLPLEVRWNMARRSAGFLLSNFLHGEQGALMVAAQLVAAVPHMDAKFYASTQTLDEARHVEVFAAYIRRLDEVHPIAPSLKRLLDDVLSTDSWMLKAVGMQVVTEGLALYSFRDMRNTTREPLLKTLLTYVSRDEARHTGYGVKYLSQIVPTLSDAEKAEIEDFAFETARLLVDSRTGMSMRDSVLDLWAQAGVDPAQAMTALGRERETIGRALARTGGRRGPVSGFILPTLRAIGLLSERIQGHFRDMWTANLGEERARWLVEGIEDLPDDLERWVNEGHEHL